MLGLRGGRRRVLARAARSTRRRRAGALRMRAAVSALIRKDVRLELRTRESVPAMVLFSSATFVLFHFALDEAEVSGDAGRRDPVGDAAVRRRARHQPAVRGRARGGRLRRLPARARRPHGAVRGQGAACCSRSWPRSRCSCVAAFAILLLGPSPWRRCPSWCSCSLLADVGLAVIGTLVAALADPDPRARPARAAAGAAAARPARDRGRPRATAPLLAEGGAGRSKARWLAILGLYDLVFGLLAYAIFDFLLED